MKLKILFITILFSTLSWGQTTVTTSGMTATCPASPTTTWTTPPTGLTFSNITRGAGVTCGTLTTGISGFGFNNNLATNITNSALYTFTITSNAATTFTLNSVSIISQVSTAAGSPNVSLQYSTDGGTTKTPFGSYVPTTSSNTYIITPGSAINVPASTTLIIYVIPYTLNVNTTTCRITNGSSVNVTASPATTAPVVTSSAATAIGTTTATLNGNVTSDGGSAVTDRGFVYKTTAGVTIADNKTTVAGTTGAFTLSPIFTVNTQYYFKAYAINAIGTTLSSPELSFYTLANVPSAPTVNNPQLTTLNVTITSGDGNPAITTYAIQEAGGLYVQASGALGASPVYQTAATWGTITVTGLSSSTTYTFTTIGKNGAGTVTAASSSAAGTTLTPATPTIIASPATLTGFTYIVGSGPSAEQNFTVSGSALTANLVITPSTNYEISTGTGGSFVATNPITFTPSGGTVTSKTIYVRLKSGLAINTYNSEIIGCTSTGAATKNVTCSGNVTAIPPTIIVTPGTLTGFTYLLGYGPSAEQTFTASGSNLTSNILLTPSTDYEISLTSGSGFGSTIILTQSGGTVSATTIYVRLKAGLAVASYNSETISATITGATTQNVTCSGSVTGFPICGSETFANICTSSCSPANSTYGSRTWTGDNGGTWSATLARTDQTITSNAITLQGLGTLTSPSYTTGIGNLTFKTKFPFTETSGSITVAVNGTTVGTVTYAEMTGTTPITKSISGINVTGTFVLTFTSATARFTIDDISWTCFSCVAPADPIGSISGTNPACNSTVLSFSGSVTSPLVYYWQTSSTGISTSIGNAGSTLNVTTSGNYYVRTYNSSTTCWSSGTVGPYAVVISTNPTITADPVASSISYASNTTFSVTASGLGLTYQWQVDITGTGTSFSNIANGGFYSNVTTSTMTITAASNTLSGYLYRCVVSASPCVPTATSNSALLTVAAPIYFRSAGSGGAWATIANWEYSSDNIAWGPAVSAPDASATAITIRSGYNISISSGTVTADDITVDSGATLISSGGTFVLNNGSATVDMQINGTFTYSSGTFTQGVSSGIAFSATATYNHDVASSTLTLPIATWNPASNCNVTGMNNVSAIDANSTIGQTFGNFTWNITAAASYTNIKNSSFGVAGTLTVGPSINSFLSFANGVASTYTNTINSLVVSGGQLNAVGSLATENLTVTNGVSVTGTGVFVVSSGSGGATVTIGKDLSIVGGYVVVLNNASSKSSTINIARDLLLSGTDPQLNLENVSSASGVATVNVGRNFSCTSTWTTYSAVDFGTGTIASNVINIVGDFTKSGNDFFQTTSTTSATGFSFNGSGTQMFSYSGANSNDTSYIVQSSSTVQLNSNLTLGIGTIPASLFTVSGTLNFGTNSIIAGNTTDPRFIVNSGGTLITSNTNGLGGTAASGSIQSFGGVGSASAAGKAVFIAGCNFTFNGNTTTPFPIPTSTAGVNNFGNPAIVNVNSSVTSNMASSNLTVTSALNINNGGTFVLNATSNDLYLNTNAALTIAAGGTFDNNGENQITFSSGTPSISITGTFITRDAQGFNGTNTAIPSIIPTLNTGSTVVYGGNNQILTAISSPNPYYNLTISGTGTKLITTSSEILVGNQLNVTSSILQIDSNKLVTVTNAINNTSGNDILVLNGGNLVQITDVDNATANNNVGNIKMTRTSRAMKIFDYIYWGSPVKENIVSQIPSIFNASYVWNLNGTINGTWSLISSVVPAKGFITRFSTASTATDFNFTGTPNNGVVKTYGDSYDNGVTTTVSGNTILLGNPYPSAISASSFVSDVANLNKIGGTLYFWTSITPVTNYTYTTNDYATWNVTGSTAVSDVSGTNVLKPTGNIASGQGFFAVLKADYNVTFNNSMRVRTTSGNPNSQFFRNNLNGDVAVHEGKIWLNLYNDTYFFRQALVGYVSGATNDYDNLYDGTSITLNPINIYSILDSKPLVIQGRQLPFLDTDLVPLGVKITSSGTYKIAIDHSEGLFNGDQNVYLQDNMLNIIHDLKVTPYEFYSASGTFNERFVLRYNNTTVLGNPDFENSNNSVVVTTNHSELSIKSFIETIQEVTVYDILGRQLFYDKTINNNNFITSNISFSQQALILKIKLENGITVTRKIIL